MTENLNTKRKYGVLGDGVAGRVLRLSKLTVQSGTTANTIKVKMESIWSGDDIVQEDNLSGGKNTGNFDLSANGSEITIRANAFQGDAVIVCLATTIYKNSCGLPAFILAKESSNNMLVYFKTIGNILDLPTILKGNKEIVVHIAYLTRG